MYAYGYFKVDCDRKDTCRNEDSNICCRCLRNKAPVTDKYERDSCKAALSINELFKRHLK